MPDLRIALGRLELKNPVLAGSGEATATVEGIRAALMQVKFSENQTLPQLNLGAQFGPERTGADDAAQVRAPPGGQERAGRDQIVKTLLRNQSADCEDD